MKMRLQFQILRVAAVNEDCAATGRVAAIDVPPAIPNHPTFSKVNSQFLRRAQQHTGFRFAAIAIRLATTRMKTNLDTIQRNCRLHGLVNHFHEFFGNDSPAHVRLICSDDDQKPSVFETSARVRHAGEDFKIPQLRRRIWQTVPKNGTVDDTVAVEEDGAARVHFVLSHFVLPTFSLGCETNKCQTTA